MNTIRLFLAVLLSCFTGGNVIAQVSTQQRKDALQIMSAITAQRDYTYRYVVNGTFPDGTRDQYKGVSYVSSRLRSVYTQTGINSLLLTPAWYMQADHVNKRVSILSMDAYYKKQPAGSGPVNDMFSNNSMNAYLDTVVLKHGIVQQYEEQASGQVRFVLTFPPALYLKKLEVIYDRKKALPVKVAINAFYQEEQGGRPAKAQRGTSKEIICDQYSLQVPDKVFKTEPFFTVSKGKVVLRQFKNYKISTLL